MKISYNPKSSQTAITTETAANDDIIFDLYTSKLWAKGVRIGADWADITNKPSSLKNPAAIKFKDINGNDVSYDGSVAKDLTSGTYIAKLPYGFHSFTSGPTWGNTEGTSIACWNDSSGGSIDFRKDNPSSGKMSIKVDGRVYVNEGKNPVLSSEYGSGFWGMRTPDGGNDWIRTSNNGLIPYVEGAAGKGHSSLGTNNWYFATAYIDKVYGSLKGKADAATTADTALSANKLTTARNIALGTDLRGSANFDGSGNITINATINSCQVSVGAKDTLPFKRIAHFETTSSYNDNALLLYISEGYTNGRTGICRIEFRTNNIATSSTSITAQAAVRWLVRNGFGLDSLYAGYYVTANKAYIDIYLKTGGGYRGTVIRVLQDSRGSINSAVQLISAKYNSDTDHKEAYSSIESAATLLYNKAYTKIVSGVDAGTVGYANSTGNAGSATKLQTARSLWGNSFDGTKDVNGSIIFPGIADIAISNKISWNGSTDGADIYYQTTAKDQGNLVLNVKDNTNAYIQLALNGTFKSHFDVANSYWTGRSARADKWTTARALTIGNTTKNVDGSENVSWSLAEIGAAPSGHTHAWNSLTHSSTIENQAILTNGEANGWKLETLNIANWNTAYNFVNSITGDDTDDVINKWDEIVNFLSGIKDDNKLNTLLNSKLSIQQLTAKDILTTKTNNALFWVNTIGTAGSITTGPFTDHPYALLSVTNYNQNAGNNNNNFFYRSRLAFNSVGDIKVASCHHQNEYKQDETWYNVLTSKNSGIDGSTIKLNGTSITVYSSGTADGRYVKKSGDTMSGVLTIGTVNFGALIIQRNDDINAAAIQFKGKSNVYGLIGLNNNNKDKQFLRWDSNLNTYTILDTSSTYTSNGKGIINGATITQVDNATNADTIDGVHVNQLCRVYTFNVNSKIIKVGTLISGQEGHTCKLRFTSGIGYNAAGQDRAMTVVIRASNNSANTEGFYFEAHSESYRKGKFTTFYLHQISKTQCELYMAAFPYSGKSIYEISFSKDDLWTHEMLVQDTLPTSNIFTLPDYQIAYTDNNVASATKLAFPRTLWGQSFDGTSNVSGSLSGTGSITPGSAGASDIGSNSLDYRKGYFQWLGSRANTNLKLAANNSDNQIVLHTNGNVGIGTNSPTYKLQVAGNIYASDKITSAGFVHTSVTENANQYVLTADGGYTFLNQTSNELAHEFDVNIAVTSEWADIEDFYGGNQSFLTQPGTYIVQVYYKDASADGMYEGYFSGIMSWYTGKTNSNNADEIVLHRVGHAYANTIYLRTRESLNSEEKPYTKLQISANSDLKQHTYKFKFKRIC